MEDVGAFRQLVWEESVQAATGDYMWEESVWACGRSEDQCTDVFVSSVDYLVRVNYYFPTRVNASEVTRGIADHQSIEQSTFQVGASFRWGPWNVWPIHITATSPGDVWLYADRAEELDELRALFNHDQFNDTDHIHFHTRPEQFVRVETQLRNFTDSPIPAPSGSALAGELNLRHGWPVETIEVSVNSVQSETSQEPIPYPPRDQSDDEEDGNNTALILGLIGGGIALVVAVVGMAIFTKKNNQKKANQNMEAVVPPTTDVAVAIKEKGEGNGNGNGHGRSTLISV